MPRKLVRLLFTLIIFIPIFSFSATSDLDSAIPMLTLYKQPSKTAPILTKHWRINEPILIIIPSKDGKWLKVANKRTGQVGWLNRAEAKKAQKQFEKPIFQTVIVTQETGSDGKTVRSILAYRDGKALKPREAEKLYYFLKTKSQHYRHSMQKRFHDMDYAAQRLENEQFLFFDDFPRWRPIERYTRNHF